MRKRDVIGKRIVDFRQKRMKVGKNKYAYVATSLDEIVLDDGTIIGFTTVETEFGFYLTEAVVHKAVEE